MLSDAEEQEASDWIIHGERKLEVPGTVIMAIGIRFETRTGKIVRPKFADPQLKDGYLSILRTYLVTEDERTHFNKNAHRWDTTPGKYIILLVYPPGWLASPALAAAVQEQYSGGDGTDSFANEQQWILPERIIPARVIEYGSSITGINEPWGESRFVNKPGDMKLFYAIEAFNRKYGPSVTEQFFRKVKPK